MNRYKFIQPKAEKPKAKPKPKPKAKAKPKKKKPKKRIQSQHQEILDALQRMNEVTETIRRETERRTDLEPRQWWRSTDRP